MWACVQVASQHGSIIIVLWTAAKIAILWKQSLKRPTRTMPLSMELFYLNRFKRLSCNAEALNSITIIIVTMYDGISYSFIKKVCTKLTTQTPTRWSVQFFAELILPKGWGAIAKLLPLVDLFLLSTNEKALFFTVLSELSVAYFMDKNYLKPIFLSTAMDSWSCAGEDAVLL